MGRKIDLAKVMASLNTLCPKCGYSIPSKETRRVSFTEMKCQAVFVAGEAAIGSLRTHQGSAHGHEKRIYKIKPRHARLASHAAFTIAAFIMEKWNEEGQTK